MERSLCAFCVFKIAHLNLQMYDECSNINASHFKAFFIDMLWQNAKRFWNELYAAFKLTPVINENTIYFSS